LAGWSRYAASSGPQEKLVQYYEALHFEQKYCLATAITGALGLYLSIAGFVG
jgi:hypothetical protein